MKVAFIGFEIASRGRVLGFARWSCHRNNFCICNGKLLDSRVITAVFIVMRVRSVPGISTVGCWNKEGRGNSRDLFRRSRLTPPSRRRTYVLYLTSWAIVRAGCLFDMHSVWSLILRPYKIILLEITTKLGRNVIGSCTQRNHQMYTHFPVCFFEW